MRAIAEATLSSLRASTRLIARPSRPSQFNNTFSQTWSRFRAVRQRPRPYSTKPDITSQLGSPAAAPSMRERFKKLGKEYGYLSVAVYLTFSALDFPFCFLAVRLAGPERIGQIEHSILSSIKPITEPIGNALGPIVSPAVDAVKGVFSRMWKGAVKTAGVEGESHEVKDNNGAASRSEEAVRSSLTRAGIWTQLALAYGIHKTLLIFVRVPLTIAYTPRIARALTKRGWKIGSSKK